MNPPTWAKNATPGLPGTDHPEVRLGELGTRTTLQVHPGRYLDREDGHEHKDAGTGAQDGAKALAETGSGS